jgi:DNA-binding beta-propeller fold protein YncE
MKRLSLAVALAACVLASAALADDDDDDLPQALPTGQLLTPKAARGAKVASLNPGLADHPDFLVDHAISFALSPDRRTALILTSGFNKLAGPDGKQLAAVAGEYVFVLDLAGDEPRRTQTIVIPNSFAGIAFAPDGGHFYVGGGKDDTLLGFRRGAGGWEAEGEPLKLGHTKGLGLKQQPGTAGLATTADGRQLAVVNFQNDSLSLVDLETRAVGEIDLRPGKGRPGGTYPFWVAIKGDDTAYVSSLRDRELVVLDIKAGKVKERIKLPGNPNRMILDKAQRRLFVTADNSDRLSVIDTASNRIVASVKTTAPKGLLAEEEDYRGAAPNALVLSDDETRLYVSNGGANDVAVIALDGPAPRTIGLIPTGWYPSDVAIAGGKLLILNGKSPAGPNPHHCSGSAQDAAKRAACRAGNDYVEQLEKASLLTLPLPNDADLDSLTRQVAANNSYAIRESAEDKAMMAELRRRIKHVIYIIKENRTYDQVLGDLGRGNGDSSLTEFGRDLTPNHHALAERFVALDNFYDSGEVSGDGWAWSTTAREADIAVKQVPVNYARRGLSYDTEGTNRDVNVALATAEQRHAANPDSPNDPDLLAGTANVTAPDPAKGPPERGYLWDAALRAKKSVRNYGFFVDLYRYEDGAGAKIPLERDPFAAKTVVAIPTNPTLAPLTDPYFRGFDNKLADFWREREWEREFAQYEAKGDLPALSLVRLMHDHFGDFKQALDKVDVPERQIADNDYALGRLVERVANSRFAGDTLIFVIEDDAQDGPDHVDAHRSIAFVAGPYVKQGQVVSQRYTTVNMLRTIEDVLGIAHLSLNDATQRPMTEIFDLAQREWHFSARPADMLYGSDLPLPKRTAFAPPAPTHDAAWWAERTKGMDFSAEDKIDPALFNRILWTGLMETQKPGK